MGRRTPEQRAIHRMASLDWKDIQRFRREEGLPSLVNVSRRPWKPRVTHIAGYVPPRGSIAWSLLGRVVPTTFLGAPSGS